MRLLSSKMKYLKSPSLMMVVPSIMSHLNNKRLKSHLYTSLMSQCNRQMNLSLMIWRGLCIMRQGRLQYNNKLIRMNSYTNTIFLRKQQCQIKKRRSKRQFKISSLLMKSLKMILILDIMMIMMLISDYSLKINIHLRSLFIFM